MKNPRAMHWRAALAAAFLFVAAASSASAATESDPAPPAAQLAQAGGTEPRDLEPRYYPAPPEEKSWYNSSYIFAVTRSVNDSTLVPAAKVPLYLLTVPLDLVLLPFATIGGLFG
jgi:hypothetical protein